MNFKLAFLTVIYFFSSNKGFSQDFTQIGTKSVHDYSAAFPSVEPDYYFFETTKDTVVNTSNAVIVECKAVYQNGNIEDWGKEVFYKNGNKTYVLINNVFHIIFDYDASVGDTIKVINEPFNGFFYFKNSTFNKFYYVIDSIDIQTVQSSNLNRFYVRPTTDSDWNIDDDRITHRAIIQGIGNSGYETMLGSPANLTVNTSAPDVLACYKDEDLNLSFTNFDCETVLNTSEKIHGNIIFQNPSIGIINLNPEISGEFSVFNFLGILVYNGIIKDNTLNFSHLPNGNYFLAISSKEIQYNFLKLTLINK